MVARSATRDLGRQLVQQASVRARIDLAADEPRGPFHREPADFLAQAFARARALALGLLACLREHALALGGRGTLGLLDHLVGALARHVDDLGGAVPRLANDLLGARFGLAQILFALRRGGQTLRDSLLSGLDLLQQDRPQVLHHQPGDEKEHDALDDQCDGYVNCPAPRAVRRRETAAPGRAIFRPAGPGTDWNRAAETRLPRR